MAQENQPLESSELRSSNPDETGTGDPVGDTAVNPGGQTGRPGWREIVRQAFNQARQDQKPVASLRELGKDKSKSLFLLIGAAVAMLLIFLGVFSSPQKAKKLDTGGRPGAPDLGRRVTPGQENAQPGSVTPMLNAQVNGGPATNNSDVTPEDVGRTARPTQAQGLTGMPAARPQVQPMKNPQEYALKGVDFSDSALAKQPGYGVGPAYEHPLVPPAPGSMESDDLRKPSLVFVRVAESGAAAGPAVRPAVLEQSQVLNTLSPGTRLVARLEAPVSTAIKEPVVAVIEYNYERDGEIAVPAGSRAVGQLRQVDRSGYVDIRFDTLEMPDGTTQKMDGAAMDLKFGPLKGSVAGKKTGTKFLVRSLTGVGTIAAYLVGAGGGAGFNGPLSESALLRERVANNVGIAGDQELNELGFNQNIVVTVPANTRFYIVLENAAIAKNGTQAATLASTGSRSAPLPSADELRQLMQLKQELSVMYQQASAPASTTQVPQR